VNALAETVLSRSAWLLVAAGFVFLLGIWLMRRLRQNLMQEQETTSASASESSGFALAAYHGVIQRLKEQEQELARLRQAENERAEASENISAAVLSNLGSGVLFFNRAGLLQQANAAAREILGYASPLGLNARQLFRGVGKVRADANDGASFGSLEETVELALRQGETFRRVEAEYQTPSGEERVLGITISPVRTSAGEMLGATCLISDLTEITKMSRQMRLRENLAALGEMSAGIAHEFKNSLATISGYAQLLSQEADPARVKQFASKISSTTSNLALVVTDFLNFARPQEIQKRSLELRPILEQCATECGVQLETAGVAGDFVIDGDPTAVRQAFHNLLRNSAEAARNGERVRVVAQAQSDGAWAKVVLRDNGSGIPREHLSKIFIPFFTTKTKGTAWGWPWFIGLSLSMAELLQSPATPPAQPLPCPFLSASELVRPTKLTDNTRRYDL
jgi:signal transduction histidine kinase